MNIFTDTSGLFAAIIRSDVMHNRAKATLTALLEIGSELHGTSYVLQETLALLQARVGLDDAFQFEHIPRPLMRITHSSSSSSIGLQQKHRVPPSLKKLTNCTSRNLHNYLKTKDLQRR